jgi:hypothetical protein
MTRLKSLVTVTVDNVFRAFPIDSERYELIACVAAIVENVSDDVPMGIAAIEDERIRAFLYGTAENFALGAIAHLQVSLRGEHGTSGVGIDRARRFALCLNSDDLKYDPCLDYGEHLVAWIDDLWGVFLRALEEAHDHQPSP